MNRKFRRGFTLIELVVAIAIMLIIFVIVFSSISSLYRIRKAYDQESILQQNFRFALERISNEFRQANKMNNDENDIILKPTNNSVDEELVFKINENSSWKVVKYYTKESGGKYVLERSEYDYATDYGSLSETPESSQPVTEEMSQLVKIYFAREGGKVGIIMVGDIDYFDKSSRLSYTTLIFSRNSPEQIISK